TSARRAAPRPPAPRRGPAGPPRAPPRSSPPSDPSVPAAPSHQRYHRPAGIREFMQHILQLRRASRTALHPDSGGTPWTTARPTTQAIPPPGRHPGLPAPSTAAEPRDTHRAPSRLRRPTSHHRPHPLLLTGAALLDPEAGTLSPDSWLLVEDGRIAAAGRGPA